MRATGKCVRKLLTRPLLTVLGVTESNESGLLGLAVLALPAATLITNGTTARAPGQCGPSVFQRLVIVPELGVPNIITPNNDNLNDVFVLPFSQRGGRLEIFNRWGSKVQEYSNYQNTWAGAGQPDGVYYYYVTDPSGNKSKGWVEARRGR